MADLDLSVGVDVAAAEEGIRRLTNTFHREIRSIDNSKAEAKVGADITKLEKQITKAKRELLDLQKLEADPNVDLDARQFNAEVTAVKARLKELAQRKAEIRIDASQIRDANREMAISSKRQETMAKQTEKLDRVRERAAAREHKLNAERDRDLRQLGILQSRAIRDDQSRTDGLVRQQAEVSRLRAAYNKLTNDAAFLEQKTGRPGGIFHTEKERLGLEKLRGEMAHVEHRIKSLGGTIDDINPDLEDNENVIRRWGESLAGTRLHLGFFSASLKQTAIGAVVLGPILTGLAGAATSLIGVLGTGLAGAAIAGAAGLAAFVPLAIGAVAVIKPITEEVGEATKAAEAYHKAVLKYGKGSKEAADAQEKLASVLHGISPGAQRAIKSIGTLKDRWRSLTQEARKPVFEALGSSISAAEKLLPDFAKQSVKAVDIVSHSWREWMKELESPSARAGFDSVLGNFNKGLPSLLDGLHSIASAFARVVVSASRALPSLSKGFAEWADNIDRSIGSGDRLDSNVDRLIRHMRDLGHLAQAAGRVTVSLFDTSADSGDNLVKTLTSLLNGWADWMDTVEGRQSLRKFFAESVDESRALFAMLGRIIAIFFQLGRATAPVSDALVNILNVTASIVQAATKVAGLNDVLKVTAKILAALWVVNRVRAFSTAVGGAARSLGLLAAAQGAAGEVGAVSAATGAAGAAGAAGGATRGAGSAAAGRAGAAGFAGGLASGLKAVRWGPLVGIGIAIAVSEEIFSVMADQAKQHSDDIYEALEGAKKTRDVFGLPIGQNSGLAKLLPDNEGDAAKNVLAQLEEIRDTRTKISAVTEKSIRLQLREVDISGEAKRSAKELLDLTRLGRKLNIRVSGNVDPKSLQALLSGYNKLRSGALASLGDIGKVTRENSRLIQTVLPRGSEEAKRKTAENFRAAADAIKTAMHNGTVSVKTGTEQMKHLLANANLLEGRDPLGLAKGFSDSWRKAGAINRRNADKAIEDLRKMPPRARQEAFQMMLAYGRGLVRGKKIPEEDLRLFKSHALTELTGISGGFTGLSGSVYDALSNIGGNLSNALKNMGAGKGFNFNLNKMIKSLPELPPLPSQRGGGQQTGGFTVSGYGSGDKKPHVLPEGSFVVNREASSAAGLNGGGPVATMLEPKEHVFLPHEVHQIGAGNLMALNSAVPRQKGGPIGNIPLPQIAGPDGSAKMVGTTAIQRAHEAAEKLFKKQAAKFSAAGMALPPGAPADLKAAERLAEAMGLSITSTTGGTHAAGSYHYQGRAFDASNGIGTPEERAYAIAAARRWGSHILELFFDPLGWYIKNGQKISGAIGGHSDHVHTAMQLGGLVQNMLSGGPVAAWDQLTGSHWDNDELATLAHIVGMQGPGRMAQRAQGESSGNRKAVGHDAGGSEGLGLWQITKGVGNDALINKWGGREAMFHPYLNARAGEEIQESNPNAWYAPLTGPLGHVDSSLADQMNAIISGRGADGVGGPKKIPKTVKASYHSYRTQPNGGIVGVQHKDVPVQVEAPDFGPLPNDEAGCRRELRQVEQVMLPQYRAAYRQTKRKDVKAKLKESLKKIEKRVEELRNKLRELRYAKTKKRTKKKYEAQLGRITGFEPQIEAARTEYEKRDQFATQVVSLEPEQFGELTPDWIAKTFEPYIHEQEEPAYSAVLGAENTWRNTILTAQEAAERITKGWEIQVGYPQDKRKPFLDNPDLHFPPRPKNGEPTALAARIYDLYDQIKRIQDFADSKPPKWWHDHPKAREQRDLELDMVKNYFRPQLDLTRYKRGSLEEVLGTGRESFSWFHGTGSFEDSMAEVQGLHWPDQHEKLDGLPPFPVAGQFGGAIWDTQETIRGLGLKIQQAKESLEGTDTAVDHAGELQAFSDAIMSLLEGRPFVSLNLSSANEPYMGAFAKGGVALVGEQGPELAHMPSGTRITDATETARLLEPKVVVDLARHNRGGLAGALAAQEEAGRVYNVTNNFAAPPPDPHTWTRTQEFELSTL